MEAIERDGVYLARDILKKEFIERAKFELARAIELEAIYHGGSDYQDYGMVLVCAQYGGVFLELLENPRIIEPFNLLLGTGCIVYANTSTSMPPHKSNYSSRIHVDSPRLIPGSYLSTFMSLILLDDFSEANGATWYLPGSHNRADRPDEEFFYQHAQRLIAPAGSVFFWNPRIWHAGGSNSTDKWRHALTLVMCRPYMKQRLDLPRLLQDRIDTSKLSDLVLQKLGFHAQVPASYDEYYASPELRKFRQKPE